MKRRNTSILRQESAGRRKCIRHRKLQTIKQRRQSDVVEVQPTSEIHLIRAEKCHFPDHSMKISQLLDEVKLGYTAAGYRLLSLSREYLSTGAVFPKKLSEYLQNCLWIIIRNHYMPDKGSSDANKAFNLASTDNKKGGAPKKHNERIARMIAIFKLIDEGETAERAFDVVGSQFGLEAETVRTEYYSRDYRVEKMIAEVYLHGSSSEPTPQLQQDWIRISYPYDIEGRRTR